MKSSLQQFWQHFRNQHPGIEKEVENRTGAYQGLSLDALYTSYSDLEQLFQSPEVSGTFADLGCGIGHGPIFYAALFPQRKAIGIEFEKARLDIGLQYKEELNLTNLELIHDNLSSCEIPEADTYFLYFPTGPVLDRILHELYDSKKFFHLLVIESHGDLFPRLALENWLLPVTEVTLTSPRLNPMAKIYRRLFKERDTALIPFDQSFKEKFIQVSTPNETWIGETAGMEWSGEERFELMTPPRTIFWRDVKKLMVLSEVNVKFHQAIMMRRLGEVEITTNAGKIQGFIRKIITEPSFGLEISTGEKVEWDDIRSITQGTILCYESSSHLS